MGEVNFWTIVIGTFAHIGNYKRTLVKALLPTFTLLLLIDMSSLLDLSGTADTLITIFAVAVQTFFAITIHRILILGPKAVSPWGLRHWTMRETIFTLYVILSAFILIPVAIFSAIPIVGTVISILSMCWLFGRCALIFPGVATDQDMSLAKSWDMTNNHQVTMTLVVALLPILGGIPAWLLDRIANTLLFSTLLSTLAAGVTVAALSVAFTMITSTELLPREEE